jgi:hypothetical protein
MNFWGDGKIIDLISLVLVLIVGNYLEILFPFFYNFFDDFNWQFPIFRCDKLQLLVGFHYDY